MEQEEYYEIEETNKIPYIEFQMFRFGDFCLFEDLATQETLMIELPFEVDLKEIDLVELQKLFLKHVH